MPPLHAAVGHAAGGEARLHGGLLARGLEVNGTDGFRGVQARSASSSAGATCIWALTTALCHEPMPGPRRAASSRKLEYADARPPLRHAGAGRARQGDLREHLGGAPLVAPSSATDLRTAELRPLHRPLLPRLERRRARADQALQAHLGRDRHRVRRRATSWYEVNYSGNQEQMRLDMLSFAGVARRSPRRHGELVEQCLADYDLDGWTAGPWVDGERGLSGPGRSRTGVPGRHRRPSSVTGAGPALRGPGRMTGPLPPSLRPAPALPGARRPGPGGYGCRRRWERSRRRARPPWRAATPSRGATDSAHGWKARAGARPPWRAPASSGGTAAADRSEEWRRRSPSLAGVDVVVGRYGCRPRS